VKSKSLNLILIAVLFLSACQKEDEKIKINIQGYAQKGPFRPGTEISISELDANLQPTGLVYYSTVSDNHGKFDFPDIEFKSRYVEIIADGYYFNELTSRPTEEKLILKAITDLSVTSSVNINILTHVSNERIKYLVQHEGKSYDVAKQQAENEILAIFSFANTNNEPFEVRDISSASDKNLQLLVVSSIFQCYDRQVSLSGLTEFLANFSFDIKENGKLDSDEIKKKIATSAAFIDVGSIRTNMNEFYENDTLFNQFPSYVDYFNKNTEFQLAFDFNYSNTTENGINLFGILDNSILIPEKSYFLAINNDPNELFNFNIILGKTTITGEIEFQASNEYYIHETHNDFAGFKEYYIFGVNSSEDLYKIKLKGTGEGKIIFELDYRGEEHYPYRFSKYFKW
jgi:hypothetical protein